MTRDRGLTEQAKGGAGGEAGGHDVPVVALAPRDAAQDLRTIENCRQAAERRAAPAMTSSLISQRNSLQGDVPSYMRLRPTVCALN